jgi:hypothetical protein
MPNNNSDIKKEERCFEKKGKDGNGLYHVVLWFLVLIPIQLFAVSKRINLIMICTAYITDLATITLRRASLHPAPVLFLLADERCVIFRLEKIDPPLR